MNRHKPHIPVLLVAAFSALILLSGGRSTGVPATGPDANFSAWAVSSEPDTVTVGSDSDGGSLPVQDYPDGQVVPGQPPTLEPDGPTSGHPLTVPPVSYAVGVAGLVDTDANTIIDENGALTPFYAKLAAVRAGTGGVVNILHVGDSHVQAGFWDGRMRDRFSGDFDSGGRGIVLPHRLTGTNEPRDYYIRTWCPVEGYRVTSNATGQKLGFTGTGVRFPEGAPGFEVWHKSGFDAITVHHHPAAPFLVPPDSLLLDMQCDAGDTPASTTYYLNRTVDTLRLEALFAPRDYEPLYYGFTLHGGSTGVIYNAVGANSAAFEHFERQTTIPDGGAAAALPDLIIISLGTNNCFGRNYRSEGLRTVVARFFSSLAENYPGVPILVTTPRESCKLQGGKRVPNLNIEDAARVIREEAARHGFACWDLYAAAGGRGIGETWYNQGLSGRDRIHLTESGYNLVGDMFYDAIIKSYNSYLIEIQPYAATDGNDYDRFREYTGRLARGYLHTLLPTRTPARYS